MYRLTAACYDSHSVRPAPVAERLPPRLFAAGVTGTDAVAVRRIGGVCQKGPVRNKEGGIEMNFSERKPCPHRPENKTAVPISRIPSYRPTCDEQGRRIMSYVKEKGPVRTKNWSGKLSFGGITAPAFAKVLEKAGATTKRSPSYRIVVSKPLRLLVQRSGGCLPERRVLLLATKLIPPPVAELRCTSVCSGGSRYQSLSA